MIRRVDIADRTYTCPVCNQTISEELLDRREYVCESCTTRFDVLVEDTTQRVALLAPPAPHTAEPLYLPRGSVRAMVALALSGTGWIMVATDQALPAGLLSLTLTVIGFYFGLRAKSESTRDRIFDPAVPKDLPLFMPANVIRVVLIAGFAITAVVLWQRGDIHRPAVLEFFMILLGLLGGYVITRLSRPLKQTRLYEIYRHFRALGVLGATLALAILGLAGQWAEPPAPAVVVLSMIVSFYFGSRS